MKQTKAGAVGKEGGQADYWLLGYRGAKRRNFAVAALVGCLVFAGCQSPNYRQQYNTTQPNQQTITRIPQKIQQPSKPTTQSGATINQPPTQPQPKKPEQLAFPKGTPLKTIIRSLIDECLHNPNSYEYIDKYEILDFEYTKPVITNLSRIDKLNGYEYSALYGVKYLANSKDNTNPNWSKTVSRFHVYIYNGIFNFQVYHGIPMPDNDADIHDCRHVIDMHN